MSSNISRRTVLLNEDSQSNHGMPESSLDPSDQNVFELFEAKFQINIPDYLKNLLEFAGFKMLMMIQEMSDDEINQIESIARIQIVRLFPDELEKYLGHFASDPKEFSFLPGHRKLILKIKEFASEMQISKVKKEMQTEDIQSITFDQNASDRVVSDLRTSSKEFENSQKEQKFKLKTPGDNLQNKEIIDLTERCRKWIRDYIHNSLKQGQVHTNLNRDLDKIKIKRVEGNTNMYRINCFLCSTKTRISRTRTGSWLISNFQKHFRKHLQELNDRNSPQRRRAYSILNYLISSQAKTNH